MKPDPCIEERRMRMTADRIAELRGPLERGSAGDISPEWSARLLEAFDEIELLRAPTRAPEEGTRIEGWAGKGGHSGWEFAPDDGRFTPGLKSLRATLIIHAGTPDSEVSEPSK